MSIFDEVERICGEPLKAEPLTYEALEAAVKRIQNAPFHPPRPYFISPRVVEEKRRLDEARKAFREGKSPLYLAGYDKGLADAPANLFAYERRALARLERHVAVAGVALGLTLDAYEGYVGLDGGMPSYEEWVLAHLLVLAEKGAQG